MRIRRALWRALGPAVGNLAPGLFTAYYGAVTRSLADALGQERDVRAVYAYGSYADGLHRPGISDVDLLLALDDLDLEGEIAALERLRRPYRRRQAVLPIDVTPFLSGELEVIAPWLASVRFRIADGQPLTPSADWQLLAGSDLGAGAFPAEARLAYLTDAHVAQALRAYATASRDPVVALGRRLGQLVRDLDREGLESEVAQDLRLACREAARAPSDGAAAVALAAALAVIEEQRRNAAVASGHPPETEGWVAEGVESALAAHVARELGSGEGLRSATLVHQADTRRSTLLLECDRAEAEGVALQALRLARRLASEGVDAHLLTTPIALDGWRTLLRTGPLLVAGQHLRGEPLAPRLSFPSHSWLSALALQRTLDLVAQARRFLIGFRGAAIPATALAQLELWSRVASGQPLDFRLTSEGSGGDEIAREILRRWRSRKEAMPHGC